MPERSSIFDMIGPIMIGPSSSHTGGVVRIGRVARKLFGLVPERAQITFYNSFARTYEGHGSDRAVLAGLLDMEPDDKRIKEAFDHAKEAGVDFSFRAVLNASTYHPNSVRIQLSAGEQQLSLLGVSKGGGMINIAEVDGFRCNFSGQQPTLIVSANDRHGSIAFVTHVISHEDCNVATMTVDRRAKQTEARQVLELDSEVRPLTLAYLESLSWVYGIWYLPGPDSYEVIDPAANS